MALYDVCVTTHQGDKITDLVTGSKRRAQERARTLVPNVLYVAIMDQHRQPVSYS